MRRIRGLLVIAALVSTSFGVGGAVNHRAEACTGDPCDGLCNFQNSHPSKLWSNGCWFR